MGYEFDGEALQKLLDELQRPDGPNKHTAIKACLQRAKDACNRNPDDGPTLIETNTAGRQG